MTTEKATVDPKKVKKGEIMAFIHFAEVTKVGRGGKSLTIADLDNNLTQINVDGEALVRSSLSADQFAKEVKENRSKVAEKLIESYNKPFTVCFDKQDGSERKLRGRLVSPEPLLGRSMVEDLDIDQGKHRLRQVDHRTLKWLVVDGIKHVVK